MTTPTTTELLLVTVIDDASGVEHTTVYVISARTPERAAQVRSGERAKALRAGQTVVNADGSRVWRVREPILGPDFRPIVHADGERVQCQWTEITMAADGERTVRSLRRVWVGYDAAMEGA